MSRSVPPSRISVRVPYRLMRQAQLNRIPLSKELYELEFYTGFFDESEIAELVKQRFANLFTVMDTMGYSVHTKKNLVTRLKKYLIENGVPTDICAMCTNPEFTRLSQDIQKVASESKPAVVVPMSLCAKAVLDDIERGDFNMAASSHITDLMSYRYRFDIMRLLQLALALRVGELSTADFTIRDEIPYVIGILKKGVWDSDLHEVYSFVGMDLIHSMWKIWDEARNVRRVTKYEEDAYRKWLKSKYGVKTHDLRRIGSSHTVDYLAAKYGRTDADRFKLREKVLRHVPTNPASIAYANVSSSV